MTIHGIDSPIEGRNDSRGRASAITHFDVELNTRQQHILDALPDYNSRATFRKEDVSMADLAALTARTGDEFALFTKGGERLVVRGNRFMIDMTPDEAAVMAKQGYTWSGHTHPGTDRNCLIASDGDKFVLRAFQQESSVIYNSLGQFNVFGRDETDGYEFFRELGDRDSELLQ